MIYENKVLIVCSNRKSRNPLVESGFRHRSSSASSSIPTPLAPTGRGLGPKSKSNLIKSSITAKVCVLYPPKIRAYFF